MTKTCHVHITHVPRTRALIHSVRCFLFLIISFLLGYGERDPCSRTTQLSNVRKMHVGAAHDGQTKGNRFLWDFTWFHLKEFTIPLFAVHMHTTLRNDVERKCDVFSWKNALAATAHQHTTHLHISISRCSITLGRPYAASSTLWPKREWPYFLGTWAARAPQNEIEIPPKCTPRTSN